MKLAQAVDINARRRTSTKRADWDLYLIIMETSQMTKRRILSAAIGLALAGVAFADEPRSVGATNLFVPQGYDDNDEIVVVLDGVLPSTCYQLAIPEVQTDYSTRKITVDIKAHLNPGPCVNVPVPFEQEIDLGSLAAGEWSIGTTVSHLESKLLIHKASTANPDEYLYAPIDSVSVTLNPDTGRWSAELTGDILATCLSFQETKLLEEDKVLVVLPILTQKDEECRPTSEHFKREVLLPSNLAPGRYLLHVRSLNGRGVNHLFEVYP